MFWVGVSISGGENIEPAYWLAKTKAAITFLSLEPLLSDIKPYIFFDLYHRHIDWVIAGGEKGPGYRSMKEEWVKSIKKACEINGIPFFFKQWAGLKKTSNLINGKKYQQFPTGNWRERHGMNCKYCYYAKQKEENKDTYICYNALSPFHLRFMSEHERCSYWKDGRIS